MGKEIIKQDFVLIYLDYWPKGKTFKKTPKVPPVKTADLTIRKPDRFICIHRMAITLCKLESGGIQGEAAEPLHIEVNEDITFDNLRGRYPGFDSLMGSDFTFTINNDGPWIVTEGNSITFHFDNDGALFSADI